jgi:hypothetical protein
MTQEQYTKSWLILYADADKEMAFKVCKVLEQNNIGCWIKERDLHAGAPLIDQVLEALDKSCGVIVILSRNFDESLENFRLVNRAVMKRKRFVIFRTDDTIRPTSFSLGLIDSNSTDVNLLFDVIKRTEIIGALKEHQNQDLLEKVKSSQIPVVGDLPLNQVGLENEPNSNKHLGDFAMVANDPVENKFFSPIDFSSNQTILIPSKEMSNCKKPQEDNVRFTVSLPNNVRSQQKFIVDVWAHLAMQRSEVERRIEQAVVQKESKPIIRSSGPFQITREKQLFVRLKFDVMEVADPEDVILWDGEIANASFVVSVPDSMKECATTGLVTIYWEGALQIARIPVQVFVNAGMKTGKPITHSIPTLRKAFVSYATEDRDEVLGRIQGMQKILPDLELFLDVLKMRSGEYWEETLWKVIPENDVFYLFWSRYAKDSAWVEKEWKCALQTKGLDFINPVPLVTPDEVPPPDELKQKHFNDWILAYRAHRRINQQN